MAKRATIGDVAKIAGVSVMTVSRVVRNTKEVSAATRKRVSEAISQLNYHPDFSARALSSQVTGNIGLLVSEKKALYGRVADLIFALEDELFKRDYSIIVSFKPAGDNKLPVLITQRKIDALIIAGYDFIENVINECMLNNFPVLIMEGTSYGDYATSIRFNLRNGLFSAISRLRLFGHTRFAFVGHKSSHPGEKMMMVTIRKILDDFAANLSLKCIWTEDEAVNGRFGDWSKKFADSTAIICSSDLLAAQVVDFFVEAGYAVPADVSVIGCGDTTLAQTKHPHLSSITIDLPEMVRKTVDCLFSLLNKQEVSVKDNYVDTRYVQRESTAPYSDVKRKEVMKGLHSHISKSLTN